MGTNQRFTEESVGYTTLSPHPSPPPGGGEGASPSPLQALVDQAYAAGRYHKLDYRAALEPPLPPEDATWAQTLLTAAGRG
jgi:hypothetical protein